MTLSDKAREIGEQPIFAAKIAGEGGGTSLLAGLSFREGLIMAALAGGAFGVGQKPIDPAAEDPTQIRASPGLLPRLHHRTFRIVSHDAIRAADEVLEALAAEGEQAHV